MLRRRAMVATTVDFTDVVLTHASSLRSKKGHLHATIEGSDKSRVELLAGVRVHTGMHVGVPGHGPGPGPGIIISSGIVDQPNRCSRSKCWSAKQFFYRISTTSALMIVDTASGPLVAAPTSAPLFSTFYAHAQGLHQLNRNTKFTRRYHKQVQPESAWFRQLNSATAYAAAFFHKYETQPPAHVRERLRFIS